MTITCRDSKSIQALWCIILELSAHCSRTKCGATRPFMIHTFIAGVRPGQTTFLRMQSAPLVKMLITTYSPMAECTTLEGNQVTQMGISNKRDYAKWHSYMFNLVTKTEDKSLKPVGSPHVSSFSFCPFMETSVKSIHEKNLYHSVICSHSSPLCVLETYIECIYLSAACLFQSLTESLQWG